MEDGEFSYEEMSGAPAAAPAQAGESETTEDSVPEIDLDELGEVEAVELLEENEAEVEGQPKPTDGSR